MTMIMNCKLIRLFADPIFINFTFETRDFFLHNSPSRAFAIYSLYICLLRKKHLTFNIQAIMGYKEILNLKDLPHRVIVQNFQNWIARIHTVATN